jgi:hypothetical protein
MPTKIPDIMGKSAKITKVLREIRKTSHQDTAVLISGENGRYRHLIAKNIHENSPRGNGPFPAIVELHGGAWCLGDRLNDTTINEQLARHGIDCEVIDVRSLVPLDTRAILGSVARTHRLFTVEENPRLCGWGAEIVSIVADEAFYDLDGPPVRITTPHVPLPAADILEDMILPTAERIAGTVRRSMEA